LNNGNTKFIPYYDEGYLGDKAMVWTVVSKSKHANVAIKKTPDYSFSSNQLIAEISLFEIQAAVVSLPIVFSKYEDEVKVCGILGLQQGQNLFVDKAGRWQSKFVPAALRSYPFRFGVLDNGEKTLVFDDESNLVVERDIGEPLFDEDGTESGLLKNYVKILNHIEQSKRISKRACALLDDYDLLEPFNINNTASSETVQKVTGFLRVKAENFHSLSNSKFADLRENHALELIFANFFSMSCMSRLVETMEILKRSESQMKNLGSKIFDNQDRELELKFD